MGHEGKVADGVGLGREWAIILAASCHLGPIGRRSPVALDPCLSALLIDLAATLLLQALAVLALERTCHKSAPGRKGWRRRNMIHLTTVLIGVLEVVDARNLRGGRNLRGVHCFGSSIGVARHVQFLRREHDSSSIQCTLLVPVFYQG